MQDLAAVGLEQDILHAEAGRAERRCDEAPAGASRGRKFVPGVEKVRPRRDVPGSRSASRLLFPERSAIEHHRHHRRALDDLDETHLAEMCEQDPEGQRAHSHAGEQHRAKQGHDPRAGAGGRKIGREREAHGLNRVQTGADEQKRERGRGLPDPERTRGVAGENEKRERHDRKAAELRHRAEPDEGHAPPAENRAVMVGAESDQRAQRREQQRQREHPSDDPGRHREFDDHDAIERADQKHGRHADRHLKEREPQEPRHRQLRGRGIGERKKARSEPQEPLNDDLAGAAHEWVASSACET